MWVDLWVQDTAKKVFCAVIILARLLTDTLSAKSCPSKPQDVRQQPISLCGPYAATTRKNTGDSLSRRPRSPPPGPLRAAIPKIYAGSTLPADMRPADPA